MRTLLYLGAALLADSPPPPHVAMLDLINIRDILLATLSLMLGLVIWLIRSAVSTATKAINDKVGGLTKTVEEYRIEVKAVITSFSQLKDSITEKHIEKSRELYDQIKKAEQSIHDLDLKLLSNVVNKDECKGTVVELKARLHDLEQAIASVDKITREQGLLLTRIDTAINAILRSWGAPS